MMKNFISHYIRSLLTLLLLMCATITCALTKIAIANSDGKTIYYLINSDGTSVSVTYKSKGSDYYNNTYHYYNYEESNIVIPETVTFGGETYNVTSIGDSAFQHCDGLTSVTIPNSVTSIGSEAFYKCSGLKKVIVPNFDIKKWCSILFRDWNANPLNYAHHLYSDENTEITELVIPNSVTSIGSEAFSGCSGLTSVTIPNSVTRIDNDAFYGCRGLTSVTIPNSVTSIGSSAFSSCSGLTSVTIGNSVTRIKDETFRGCSGLTSVTIPNGVTYIGEEAFRGCSGLTSVTIPNSVTSIEDKAFSGCSNLTSITWNAKNCKEFLDYTGSSNSDANPFYGIRTQITEFIIGDEVTSIPAYMCCGMSNLKSINIPNSVTSIGYMAFSGCSGLTSVTIPNSVTSIDEWAFNACSSLTTITWNAKSHPAFNSPEDNPFYGIRTQITEFIIGDDVTSIPKYLCYQMSNLKSITIPNSVTSISSWAFNGCYGLKSITWNAKKYPAFSSYSSNPFYGIRSRIKEFIIGDEVISIPAYMCYEMSNLESVTIPNSVTSIGANAFSGCSGLQKVIVPNIDIKKWCNIKFSSSTDNPLYYAHHLYSDENTEITELVIPDDVTNISSYAFYNTRIKSLTIGTGIQTIASQAFSYSITNGAAIGAYPVKVIWLANTPPSTYGNVGGKVNYVPNDSYSGLSNTKIYPFLSSMFEVDGIKYVPVSPSERTCDAIDCVYNESAENTKIGNTVTYKNITMTVKNVGDSICSGNTFIKELDYSYNGGILSKNFSGCSNITSITIGSGVKRMIESAFSDCKNITSVTWNAKNCSYSCSSSNPHSPFYNSKTNIIDFIIGEDVVAIPAYMCYEMSNLKSINIPDSVTSIGSSAFYGCSGLEKAIVPNINIKNWCSIKFSNSTANPLYYAHHLYSDENTEIMKLVIPDDVTSINSYAFSGCSGLTSVTIPNSVTSIGSSAFYGCSGLEKAIVPNINIKNWCSIKFSNLTANPLYYAHHLYSDENTEITKLVIPDGVTTIPNYVFSGCSGLTSVTIPNSVTSIGSSVFSGCSGLQKVIVPNIDIKNWCNIKFTSSTDNPLSFAHHLYSDENTEITKLVIPDGVTTIPNYAFSGCSGLTSVTIPNSVTSIGEDAFSGCRGLTSITWNAKNYPAISSVSSHPFYDISTQITKFIIGDDLTSIPKYMCYGMSNLKSVTIPNSVTSIGDCAFSGCSGLTSVTIPNSVTSIGSSAFSDCSGLTSVTIPNSVTSIGNYAFSDCSGLTSMTIGNSVTDIGSSTFSDCSGLTSVTIPNSVTSIGSSAFSGCSGLTSITWNAKNYPAISSYSSNPFYNIRTQITEFVIGDDMTSIPSYMCYEMSNLKSVIIPNSVTNIGSSAFSGCSGLTSVTIPNSVTSIGSSAFNGCSGLQKVIVPNIDIKNWCNIKFTSSTDNPLSFAHHLYSDENTEITKLVIPNDVTSINSYAFYGCSGLTSVTFPNSVTSIGQSAFFDCSGLKKIIVPDIKNWCRIKFGNIDANPLYYAHHLYSDENTEITKLVIPNNVTSINSYAFSGCSSLTSVTIGNSVTTISSSAFNGCSGLTSVRFENSKDNTPLTLGSNYVFSDCPLDEVYIGRKLSYTKTSSAGYSPFYKKTTLRSVKFTDKETEISDYEFYGCTNLTDVSMGDGVKSIGTYAFSGCSSLEHFTCGRQLESIGKEAFSDCTSMTKFRTRAAVPPTCGAQALDDINKWECTLYVPTESIDDYQAADQWKNFFFIEKFNLQGDSNGDDVVNAKDYSGVASHIMGDTPATFDAETSDVDENGDIDVRDYVGIANIISTGSIYGGTNNNAKAAMSKGSAMPATDESDAENVIYVENVSGSKNSQVELSVCMKNASDIRGFQFDLYLPEGVSMAANAEASLSSDRLAAGDAHTLMADEMTDGAVRFLCSSMNDESFAGGDGEIATLTVNIADNVANGDYDVVVKNALMTETDISKSYEADNIKSTLTVLDQTGVETVTADDERRDGTIYTVGGQLVGNKSTTSQLRKGVYIRNGKKIVVK